MATQFNAHANSLRLLLKQSLHEDRDQRSALRAYRLPDWVESIPEALADRRAIAASLIEYLFCRDGKIDPDSPFSLVLVLRAIIAWVQEDRWRLHPASLTAFVTFLKKGEGTTSQVRSAFERSWDR